MVKSILVEIDAQDLAQEGEQLDNRLYRQAILHRVAESLEEIRFQRIEGTLARPIARLRLPENIRAAP